MAISSSWTFLLPSSSLLTIVFTSVLQFNIFREFGVVLVAEGDAGGCCSAEEEDVPVTDLSKD